MDDINDFLNNNILISEYFNILVHIVRNNILHDGNIRDFYDQILGNEEYVPLRKQISHKLLQLCYREITYVRMHTIWILNNTSYKHFDDLKYLVVE